MIAARCRYPYVHRQIVDLVSSAHRVFPIYFPRLVKDLDSSRTGDTYRVRDFRNLNFKAAYVL